MTNTSTEAALAMAAELARHYETGKGSCPSELDIAEMIRALVAERDDLRAKAFAASAAAGNERIRATAAEAENSRLRQRLEIDYVTDGNGNRVTAPPDTPDGIECRDATIKLCEERVKELAARVKVLEEALRPFAQAPSHGTSGGPMTTAKLIYEDGTDEDEARHRGRISPVHFRRARAALEGKP